MSGKLTRPTPKSHLSKQEELSVVIWFLLLYYRKLVKKNYADGTICNYSSSKNVRRIIHDCL